MQRPPPWRRQELQNRGLDELIRGYRDLSLIARLCAVLVGVEAWCGRHGFSDPQVDRCLDLLWSWPSVTSDDFQQWADEFEAAPLRERLAAGRTGAPLPRVVVECLECADDIVGHHLCTIVDDDYSLGLVRRAEGLLGTEGVGLPPAELFADQLFGERGTGPRADPNRVAAWRLLAEVEFPVAVQTTPRPRPPAPEPRATRAFRRMTRPFRER